MLVHDAGKEERAESHPTAKCRGRDSVFALLCMAGLVVAIVLGALAVTGNFSPSAGDGEKQASGVPAHDGEAEGGPGDEVAGPKETANNGPAPRTCTDESKTCSLAEYARAPFGDLLL